MYTYLYTQYGRHATNFGLYTPLMDKLFGTYEPVFSPETAGKLIAADLAAKAGKKAN